MAATFHHRICSSSSPSLVGICGFNRRTYNIERSRHFLRCIQINGGPLCPTFSSTLSVASSKHKNRLQVVACVSPSHPQKSPTNFTSSTKLYVSGLSFRTSEESLRNAFQSFGQLIEVNLVMDKIANRPRGFAFLRYATKEESEKAIEGMHGKFLDGRVIFVEFAKPRSQLHQRIKQDS